MQYLKKEVNDEVYFWHVDKHQIFLVDSIILGVRSQECAYLCNISRKTWRIKVFLPTDKHIR